MDTHSTAASASHRSIKSSSASTTLTASSSPNAMSNEETVAAMRHLRLVVQAIATDENLSPTDRHQRITNFEQLLDQAEKKLHYKKGGGRTKMGHDDDPLSLNTTVEKTTAISTKKKSKSGRGSSNSSSRKERKKKGWLRAGRLLGRRRRRKSSAGVLETLPEVEEEARGDIEVQRDGSNDRDQSNKALSTRDTAPTHSGDDDYDYDYDDDDNTVGGDSIIDLRVQNSEDYVASVCSIRSLGTFEKDFINNLIDEQAKLEEISVSTFEKDFNARDGQNHMYPTHINMADKSMADDLTVDDLTVDDAISETTFEQDARSLEPLQDQAAATAAGNNDGSTFVPQMPPRTVTTENDNNDDVDDDITVDTVEREEQRDTHNPLPAVGSAPASHLAARVNNFVKTALSMDNSSSIQSVSTFEKDAKALTELAAKIGRSPSTTPKSQPQKILSNVSDRSCSTFEQDQRARKISPLGIVTKMSEQSTSTFEKDFHVREPKPHLSAVGEATSGTISPTSGSPVRSFVQPQPDPAPVLHSPPSDSRLVVRQPSETTFEKDNKPTTSSAAGWFGTRTNNAETIHQDDDGTISICTPPKRPNTQEQMKPRVQPQTGLSNAARNSTATVDKTQLQKISPLVVELSPHAIDRGVNKSKGRGFWGKFACA